MYERIKECPICEHTEFSNDIICTDHLVTDESFAIVKCNNCELRFTNPRPTIENIVKYYESEDYDSHKEKGTGLIDLVYNFVRQFALTWKKNLINQLAGSRGKLLDVGCGTGKFLLTMSQNGWNVTGIENNEKARFIAQQSDLQIFNSIDELQVKKEYDVISLWHVLEHLHDLKGSMKKFRRLLKKDGHLIIAVPNGDSWDCRHYGEYWAGYDVPRHLYHFNQLTINKLAKECKFKIEQIHPMVYDSFYVSLLSEKYIHGGNKYVSAIISGLKSNRWAKWNKENFSSLTYILTKR